MKEKPLKELYWVGNSKENLMEFPDKVRQEIGFSLHTAQIGRKAINACPMVGFGGAGVLEVVADHDGDTFRAVYTVKLEHAIYVLHCFQKKSKTGIKTPKKDVDLIKARMKLAEQQHNRDYKKRET